MRCQMRPTAALACALSGSVRFSIWVGVRSNPTRATRGNVHDHDGMCPVAVPRMQAGSNVLGWRQCVWWSCGCLLSPQDEGSSGLPPGTSATNGLLPMQHAIASWFALQVLWWKEFLQRLVALRA
jgi:hypothetical protein